MEFVVNEKCKGVKDGEVYPVTLRKGDKVTGNLGLSLYYGGLADKPRGRKRVSNSQDSTASRAGDTGRSKKSSKADSNRKPAKSS